VEDPSVSKRHAVVRWDGTKRRCSVKDLASMNGTLVNGSRIEQATLLRDSDLISFGDAQFLFLQSDTLYVKLKAPRRR
jgi:pSer/pThr/pTyr-binding forkhead associated (FHA) protein